MKNETIPGNCREGERPVVALCARHQVPKQPRASGGAPGAPSCWHSRETEAVCAPSPMAKEMV